MNMTRRLPSKNSQISGEGRPCVRRAHLRAETQGSQPSMAAMSEQSLKDGYEVASLTWGSQCRGSRVRDKKTYGKCEEAAGSLELLELQG